MGSQMLKIAIAFSEVRQQMRTMMQINVGEDSPEAPDDQT